MSWKHSRRMRRAVRQVRGAAALLLSPVAVVAATLPGAVAAAGVAVVAATAAVAAGPVVPASATTGIPVLVLLQNGETTAPETMALQSAGYSVTQDTPAQWLTLTAAQFKSYAAVVIGDPSSGGSCSTLTPTTATSGTDGIGTTWQSAVTGNLAIIGTAPALSGTAAATALITNSVAYAAAAWSSSGGTGTGLYLSLNCEYATAAVNTTVPLLSGVEGIGSGNSLTVQGSLSCSDSGTVNGWGAANAGTFSGYTSASLAAGGPTWPSPACPVKEAFDSWPGKTATWSSGTVTPLAYDAADDATANFTASDGATGQPYILLASPSQPAASLSPSTGGQVPADAATGGGNAAVPGLAQPASSDVNTESGDLTQAATDVSVPGFGPGLSFARTYDSQAAQRDVQTGTPGSMGNGWTDNWASSLSATSPTPDNVYTIAGLRSDTGDGGSPSDVIGSADAITRNGSDVYVVDESDNHVLEIPATSKTQWGRSMTAGKMYVVAGSTSGALGDTASGAALSGFLLNAPAGLAFDAAGNMIIADSGNNRVLVVPAATGSYYGVSMTAGDVYKVAGQSGTAGTGGDGGADTASYLDNPVGLAVSSGDLYIADAGNNRVQEIYEGGNQWAQTMTANDIYTVAGSSSGTAGDTVSTLATSALLSLPEGVTLDASGNLYIADTGNNAVKEVAKAAGTQWAVSMTAHDLYDVAGSSSGTSGTSGNGGKATVALLNLPVSVAVGTTGLYIADSGNNRVQEAALTTHTEWGISMTANDVYTVAGSSTGSCGFSGDGASATSAKMCYDVGISVTPSSAIYIADEVNNRVREVSSTDVISTYAGDGLGVADAGNGGPAVSSALYNPEGEAFDPAGDVFIADAWNNRIQEIAARTHTQFGIAMTAGDVYTVAGNPQGQNGSSGDGGLATAAYLYLPQSIATDSAGNLYIADSDNCRIQKIATATGDITTVAGSAAGTCGAYAGNGGAATSATLSQVQGIAVDRGGDIFIADTFNNRVEEVYEGGQTFGLTMTAGDIYDVAGNGTQGYTGNAGAATSAEVYEPDALGTDAASNLYISDWGNNRIREVPAATGTQRAQSMTRGDIYAIAGNGTAGATGDGGSATGAELNGPGNATVNAAGDLYISDSANNRVQEVPVASGTQWGQKMTANDVYTIIGSATGAGGNSGDGGSGLSARLTIAENVSLDPEGDVYVTDKSDNRLRELVSAAPATITPAPTMTSALSPAPGGITVTQPGGADVTFYGQSGGACPTAPYTLVTGQYCARPENTGTSLAYNSSTSTYTFQPKPGTAYTYNSAGQLTAQEQTNGSGAAVSTLTIGYGTPAVGAADPQGISCPSSVTVGGTATTITSCDTITAPVGSGGTARTLVLGLASDSTGHALIRSVTDPMSRTWLYGYAGDNLTTVQDPVGNVTSYAYDTGNANPLLASDILTVTKPNGQSGGPDAGKHLALTWDTSGRVTAVTDPMSFKTTYTWTGFNPSTGTGLVTVADPDGNKTVYDYQLGTLAAQSTWTGATLTAEEDYVPDQSMASGDNAAGTQLDTATTDGNDNLTTTTYDTRGNAATITAPDGNGNQVSETTQQTTSLNLASCTQGLLASSTCSASPGPAPVTMGGTVTPPGSIPPLGITWTQYDSDGNQLWSTSGVYEPGASTASYARTSYQLFNGNSVTLSGTAISCVTPAPSPALACATINPDDVVTQLTYTANGDLASTSTPDGNPGSEMATATYGYDGDGERNSATTPDGNLAGAIAGNYTTITAYNGDGRQTSVTAAGGSGATVTARVTSYGYDGDGNRTTVKDARSYTTTTSYNADDQSILVTDPDGNQTLTCYDNDGNLTQTVPGTGVAANSLTAASCPASFPAGYTTRLATDATSYAYDGLSRQTAQYAPVPVGQTSATGYETTSYAYDGNGNVIQTTAPATSGSTSQVTVSTYTTVNKVASQTSGYGTSAASTTSYCYDAAGDKTAVIYADGNVGGIEPCGTNASYPNIVDPVAYPSAADYQTTYGYDSAQEIVSTATPKTTAAPGGATTTETYDPAGNTLTRTDPNGTTATWTYTPLNREASVTYSGTSAAPPASYGYDASGNQVSMTDATGSSSAIYDSFGELTSATNGAAKTVTYGYTPTGSVASIGYPLPVSATWAMTSTVGLSYDNAGLLNQVTDFNGNNITISHTPDGAPSTVGLGSTGDTITSSYDEADNTSAISAAHGTSTLQSFTYSDSAAGTILSEADVPSSPASPATYTYDAGDRVTSDTAGTGPAANYTYDASGSLTTLPTGGTGTYDDAGELTSSTVGTTATSYAYDKDGERLSETSGGTAVASGTWNGAGQLTAYTSPASAMTAAAYDGNGERASDTTGGTNQGFTWDTVGQVPQVLTDATNAYIYSGANTPAEQVNLAAGTITYLVADSLGSVRGTISSSGTLTGSTSYDAWGNPRTTGGLTTATPFGYAGGYTDPTGLIYLINRYYDPQVGQFISVDPDLSQTVQPYGYASGDPVSSTDPTGQWACSRTNSWSSGRTCWAYVSERQVRNIELAWGLIGGGVGGSLTAVGFAAAKRVAIADLCADAWEVCALIVVAIAALIAYVAWADWGSGEYLVVDEWRWVVSYVSGITWYGSLIWSAWDGYWIPWSLWLEPVY